ncbi:hydroxyisourate hydrolase [Nocardioides sp. Kera G14]|uniref:hydroxyisourate hydrolase n=1 Tax=Nocardioides sp. Kera G14 TaxID=2884264 RepID=UPI001D110200|nr:hydroxyisourate hydrolase [Nocardioides sp. Kera G14]UDY23376.1 hydroxyisourate hydrolase [Nocardioides sp. Kera G14]
MSTVSTHVLDAQLGRPAAGMGLTLTLPSGATLEGKTDSDGRLRFSDDVPAGTHSLVFATGEWFEGQGRATFYPSITVTFTVTAGEHHHVALLLSPFSYTTYRGS